jgi:hypothetical protein
VGIGREVLCLCRIGTAMGCRRGRGRKPGKTRHSDRAQSRSGDICAGYVGLQPTVTAHPPGRSCRRGSPSHAKWYRNVSFAHLTRDGSGGGEGQAMDCESPNSFGRTCDRLNAFRCVRGATIAEPRISSPFYFSVVTHIANTVGFPFPHCQYPQWIPTWSRRLLAYPPLPFRGP